MEQLQLSPAARRVGSRDRSLRPRKHGCDGDVLGSDIRQWNMFLVVAEIFRVRRSRRAVANIERERLLAPSARKQKQGKPVPRHYCRDPFPPHVIVDAV